MAKPIKETPILYGDEARRFELRMQSPVKLSIERLQKMKEDYEFLRSRAVNCAF